MLLQRSTSGIRLLSAPEAAGQNGDTYPDLELRASPSLALAAITNASHRRTNQMQEPHIDHSVSSSHMTSPQQGLERKGGRANHTQSDAHECISSVLLSLSVSSFVSLMLTHDDFLHLTSSCPSHFPLFALQHSFNRFFGLTRGMSPL